MFNRRFLIAAVIVAIVAVVLVLLTQGGVPLLSFY